MYINFEITVPHFCSGTEVSCQTCVEIVFSSFCGQLTLHQFPARCFERSHRFIRPRSLAVQTPEGLDGRSFLFYILRRNYTPLTLSSLMFLVMLSCLHHNLPGIFPTGLRCLVHRHRHPLWSGSHESTLDHSGVNRLHGRFRVQ